MADGSLLFNTKLDSTGFTKGLNKLSGLTKTGLGGIGKIAGATAKAVKSSMMVGGAAILGFGAYAIKAGSDFDAGMSEVQAISGGTAEDMEALRAKAKEMGATTKFSATESAEALKYMAMAGWDNQKMLDALPGVMNLAAASGENLGTVSDIVTDSMTAFGLEASKAGDFADLLAATASKSNTNVSMLGESFKYVAPLAGAMGYKAEDVSVALGLMANAGIKGSQAGTSLRTALTNLASPSEKMATAMDSLGISITDANGEMKPLDQLMGEMRGTFSGLTKEQQAHYASTIFGKNAMSGMLAVLNASDDDFKNLTENLNNATGAADEMAKAMNDNLKGDITLFKSALEGVAISLYEGVDNPAREVVQSFTGYMGQLQKAVEGPDKRINEFIERTGMTAEEAGMAMQENQSMAERIGETLGGILADMTANFAKAVPEIMDAAKSLIGGFFDGLMANSESIFSAGSEIINGLLQVILEYSGRFLEFGINAITEIVMGLSQKAPDLVATALESIELLTQAFFENMPLFLEAGGQIIIELAKGLVTAIPQVAIAIVDLVQFILYTLLEIAPELIQAGFDMLSSLAQGISEYIPALITLIAELIPTILTALIEGLPQLIEAGLTILSSIVAGILNALPILIEAVPQLITTLLTAITESLPLLLESGIEILTSIMDGIIENLPLLVDASIDIINSLIQFITDNIPVLVEAAVNILNSLVEFVLENAPLLLQAALDILNAIVTGIVDNLPLIMESAVELIDSLITTITENLPLLIDVALGMIMAVVEGLIENLDKIIEATVTLVDALITAVVDNLPAIIEATIKIVLTIAQALIDNLDKLIPPMIDLINTLVDAIIDRLDLLIDAALKIILAVTKGLIDNLPKIIDATIKLISAITTEIIARLPELIESGLKIITEVARGIVDNLPKIIEAAGELLGSIVETIIGKLPDILKMGADLVAELIKGLLGALGDLIGTAGDLAGAAIDAVKEGFSGAFDIGKNLVTGLWKGIGSVKDWIMDKIGGFAGGILDGIKGFFGIRSPSKVMEDDVGEQLPPGIGNGVKKATPKLLRAADNEMDKLKDHLTTGLTIDTEVQAKSSKEAIKSISEFDYTFSDDGKKLIMAGDIHNVLEIEGRPVARAITPYISEEQSLNLKRRKS